jgi:hypothetical protein
MIVIGVEAELFDIERLRPVDVGYRHLDQLYPHFGSHW